jgi:D-alanine transaminase
MPTTSYDMIVYYNGSYQSKDEVCVSPDDRGFLLADGVYEVIRAYEGRLFRLTDHLQRLARSLREIRIEGVAVDHLQTVAERLILENDLARSDASVYIQVTRGAAPRRHAFPSAGTVPTVYMTASSFRPHPDNWTRGIKVVLVPDIRWTRCDIKAVALLPNVLANQQAKAHDAWEAVFVRDGVVTEGSHTNVCAVFDGELFTHPLGSHILGGITRDVVLELCQELDIRSHESPIPEPALARADELMITGTTTEITPVVQVDDWQVADGRPGPVTRGLQQAFRALVEG